ncbi:MAG: heterodisulfide reductase-related iron-sulfur binding cluster [Actinomycetes bacterium]
MTITYDPKHPQYLDEADVREELTRVYDLCHGCRLCFKFCTSFPTLFSYVDKHEDQDAGRLTPAEQDQVIDECFQCKLCYVNCPYIPELHEWALDFPRLMLRAQAMRHATGQVTLRKRATTSIMGHTDALGTGASAVAPVAHKVMGAKPNSVVRKAVAATAGVSAVRLLPPYAKTRFSTWFKKRTKPVIAKKQGDVAVFPTCLVEYQQPGVGKDLVRVFERNGVECSMIDGAGCCGAPYLHSGDVDSFTKVAVKQVKALATAVRSGKDIVVPQPTCGYVLKKDYVDYVGGPDAELVAKHTFDSSEYLINLHKAEGTELDTEFTGTVPETISYHIPCHLKAQNIGLRSRDLMKLTGAKIKLIDQCSGIDGMWGLKAGNEEYSVPLAVKLGEKVTAAGSEAVVGDCHLANTAIAEQTGAGAVHPLNIVARAYGIPEND